MFCNAIVMGKVIIFSAPSGSGKSTIVNYLLSKNLGLEFSVSATCRAPRGEEKHGKEYYFFSTDEFKKRIEAEEFLMLVSGSPDENLPYTFTPPISPTPARQPPRGSARASS